MRRTRGRPAQNASASRTDPGNVLTDQRRLTSIMRKERGRLVAAPR
jgi:hypothetical protein